MDYPEQGFLPEAMINYLARLGWSHGDEEIFSVEQMCAWFNLDHLSKSPAQFNPEKLAWLNAHYIKQTDNARLEALVRPRMAADGAQFDGAPELQSVLALMKDRAATVNELAAAAMLFFRKPVADSTLLAQHVTAAVAPALADYARGCEQVEWRRDAIAAMMKSVLAAHQLKMPQLAMPLRLLLTGQLQTPSIDAVVELLGRETVLARLRAAA